MQMVEALGSAPVANAISSCFFLFWRVLRPPLRKQVRVLTQFFVEVDMLRHLQALEDHVTVAASSRTEHSWAGHSPQSGRVTSFSASLPL